jgi:hypothetical protein
MYLLTLNSLHITHPHISSNDYIHTLITYQLHPISSPYLYQLYTYYDRPRHPLSRSNRCHILQQSTQPRLYTHWQLRDWAFPPAVCSLRSHEQGPSRALRHLYTDFDRISDGQPFYIDSARFQSRSYASGNHPMVRRATACPRWLRQLRLPESPATSAMALQHPCAEDTTMLQTTPQTLAR